MIRIYFDNKPVFLTSDTSEVEDYLHREHTIFIDELNAPAVNTMISEMEQDHMEAGILLHSDIEASVEEFKKKMSVLPAAGGFVHTGQGKILLIFRRGKWDLPKGKLDDGETIEQCAEREVKEETGLTQVQLGQRLLITYHWYHQNKQRILKETQWFLMKAEEEELSPQLDEQIEKCEWVAFDQLSEYLANTYALIRDVTDAGLEALGQVRRT